MKLTGKEEFIAPRAAIWNILMDTEKLTRITPGLSHLEATGPDEYVATADVKIGPVKGSFKGEMSITEKQEEEAFTLNILQKSKVGNVDAAVRIELAELAPEQTELSFVGQAKMSGLLARTGARVMTGVANSLSKQFFAGLREELDASTTG
ncbi:MAG: carbon monoxide dehydrogenase subunit G [Bacteroidota bacterium]